MAHQKNLEALLQPTPDEQDEFRIKEEKDYQGDENQRLIETPAVASRAGTMSKQGMRNISKLMFQAQTTTPLFMD